ncbi:metal ABC transporter ATP-binding protein [Schaalia suimastitidis]|uniref:metal ABC transporter ATP-binding protein n=1 Tax=Schaalia suimastitidis TaxID=121163 RepID=UPI0003FCFF05|nr:metal ABC transporter ATP-binding protein [Schaalia suimastitidis]
MNSASHQVAGTPVSEVPAIAVENLHVAWDSNLVLHGVSFALPQGEVLAVTGANGSGKSTLIRAILGNAPITAGTVSYFGEVSSPTTTTPPWHRIGYVPQRVASGGAIASTSLEVVASGLLSARKWWLSRSDRAKAMAALDEVGLAHKAKESFTYLSGGQKQRVLIARALVRKPDLLLMDEPMAGVDQHSRQRLADVVEGVKKSGRSVLVILHELGELGVHIDRELHISAGHISYDGPPHLDDQRDQAHRDGGHHVEAHHL